MLAILKHPMQIASFCVAKNTPVIQTRGYSAYNFYDQKDFSCELKASLDKVDKLRKEFDALQPSINSNLRSEIQYKLKMQWTYHSNAIEGSRLSLGDTLFFLREGLTVNGKPLKDFLDAQNHDTALDYMYQHITEGYAFEPAFIREINALLLTGINEIDVRRMDGKIVKRETRPGEYKTIPNYVVKSDGVMHQYMEPFLVPHAVTELVDWVGANIDVQHPVLTAAIAHYNLVRIHPFEDGNGRCARVLMNLILLRKGYVPNILHVEERRKYMDSLDRADKGDIVPFTSFVSDSLIKTYDMILADVRSVTQKEPAMVE